VGERLILNRRSKKRGPNGGGESCSTFGNKRTGTEGECSNDSRALGTKAVLQQNNVTQGRAEVGR